MCSFRYNKQKKTEIALQESQYFIERINEASPDVIYIYDLQEKHNVYSNGQINRLLGYSTTEIESMGSEFLLQIIHPDDIPKILEHHHSFTTANDEDVKEIEYRIRDYQGNWHWFLSHDTIFIRNSENQPQQIIGAALEMTERKQMEAELRQKNAELAHATRLKDEFLANTSHELRTPLNAILGMSESLLEEVFGNINERQNKAIKTIERSGKHLLDLINDILDLSKVEAGKLDLQLAPVSCSSLCNSSLIFVKQQALKKNIQLSLEIPEKLPDLLLDERRIKQVLINLLNNAVKFTSKGGQVKLVVEQGRKNWVHQKRQDDNSLNSPPQNQWICFSVIDNGIGIEPEDVDNLFQPFMQIDSSLNRQHNGTGLGLALVKRLVDLHHGEINISSEVDKGSCFSVQIPCIQQITQVEQPINYDNCQLLTNPKLENSSVLVIEDSVVAAEQLTKYLHELKIQTTIYTQGNGAVNQVIIFNPDLIFLDIELPNVSGWEILKQLKANPKTKYIPIIVISVVDERSQALSLGANDYLVKPINRGQICQVLNKLQKSDRVANSSTHPTKTTVTNTPTTAITATQAPLILIAEDNQANIATISNYLDAKGYRIILAKDGQEAVNLTQEQHPDLILMDIQMPGMDGLEAMNLIRANPQFQHTPIIAITALAMAGDREKCIAAGANDYISKPIKLKFLVEKIQQLLN